MAWDCFHPFWCLEVGNLGAQCQLFVRDAGEWDGQRLLSAILEVGNIEAEFQLFVRDVNGSDGQRLLSAILEVGLEEAGLGCPPRNLITSSHPFLTYYAEQYWGKREGTKSETTLIGKYQYVY